jgi:ATP-dependent Clp protease ATP-binding subunit ClpB
VSKRLAERHIELVLTPAARDLIATLGYDPMYGARPLKRVIQKHLLDPLALKLLNGEIREGETLTVDAENHEFRFRGSLSGAKVVA